MQGLAEVLPPVAAVSESELSDARDQPRCPKRKRPAAAVVRDESELQGDAEESHTVDDLA